MRNKKSFFVAKRKKNFKIKEELIKRFIEWMSKQLSVKFDRDIWKKNSGKKKHMKVCKKYENEEIDKNEWWRIPIPFAIINSQDYYIHLPFFSDIERQIFLLLLGETVIKKTQKNPDTQLKGTKRGWIE